MGESDEAKQANNLLVQMKILAEEYTTINLINQTKIGAVPER
jgi:hypothetical protein